MTNDSNPFRSVQQFFEQFGTTGSDSVIGLGWPLSPVPIPGRGVNAASPEESTKRAVKQLSSALAALSEDESVASAGDAWSQYLDAFEFGTTAFGPEQLTAATLRTYRIWFFSLTQVLVESYTLCLVHDELVVEDHRQKSGTQKWLWGLPQSDREQLLERCTDVPDDLVGEMETLRHRRDELLYTFGGWDNVAFDDSLEEVRRTLKVLTALDDRVTDGSPFSYFPKNAGDTETGDRDESEANGDEDIGDDES